MRLRKIWKISNKNLFLSLHLNIRSMSKNLNHLENLQIHYVAFSAISLSETWCQPHETSNSNLEIPGYVTLHQARKNRRWGGLCIFLLESLSYKVRDDLAVISCAIECLCVKISNKNLKSIVLNFTYRPPNGDLNELENYFKNIISKREITNKELVLVGDFNINVLDFNDSKFCEFSVSTWPDSHRK